MKAPSLTSQTLLQRLKVFVSNKQRDTGMGGWDFMSLRFRDSSGQEPSSQNQF